MASRDDLLLCSTPVLLLLVLLLLLDAADCCRAGADTAMASSWPAASDDAEGMLSPTEKERAAVKPCAAISSRVNSSIVLSRRSSDMCTWKASPQCKLLMRLSTSHMPTHIYIQGIEKLLPERGTSCSWYIVVFVCHACQQQRLGRLRHLGMCLVQLAL